MINKSKRETTLDIENLWKKSGVIDASINKRIHEIEEIISGAEDSIENIDTTVKKNAKCKKPPNSNHPGNPGQKENTKVKDYRYRREWRFPA